MVCQHYLITSTSCPLNTSVSWTKTTSLTRQRRKSSWAWYTKDLKLRDLGEVRVGAGHGSGRTPEGRHLGRRSAGCRWGIRGAGGGALFSHDGVNTESVKNYKRIKTMFLFTDSVSQPAAWYVMSRPENTPTLVAVFVNLFPKAEFPSCFVCFSSRVFSHLLYICQKSSSVCVGVCVCVCDCVAHQANKTTKLR